MLITHAIRSLDPKYGGPGVVAVHLAAAQAAEGLAVEIVTDRETCDGATVGRMTFGVPGFDRVRIREGPDAEHLGPILRPRARRFLAETAARSGFVWLHGMWEPQLRVLAAECARVGTPYAVVPHGMLDPWRLARKRLKKRIALALGHRAMLERAAFVHALNADEAEFVTRVAPRARVEVVPNGIPPRAHDAAADAAARARFRARLGIGDGTPVALFLSRLHEMKGVDMLGRILRDARDAAPDALLAIVGPDEGGRDALVADLRAAGVERAAQILGPLYAQDKLDALAGCDVFILPSRSEGFSMSILEAMSVPRAVVITRDCHFPEVEAAGAGAVTATDAGELGRALGRLLADRASRDRAAAAGAALVRERYTWPSIARRTLDLIASHARR